ncbi:hypothetical protein MRX96_056842 [Rhipicephalus microplus]
MLRRKVALLSEDAILLNEECHMRSLSIRLVADSLCGADILIWALCTSSSSPLFWPHSGLASRTPGVVSSSPQVSTSVAYSDFSGRYTEEGRTACSSRHYLR